MHEYLRELFSASGILDFAKISDKKILKSYFELPVSIVTTTIFHVLKSHISKIWLKNCFVSY